MRIIVQKFGGKCVEPGGNELVTAERIMETRDQGDFPVVVVSAMGRELRDWNEELDNLIRKPDGARQLALAHFYSTAELVRLVREIDPDIEPRELDLLMSCGEIISTVRLAHLLKSRGYCTVALSGGQVGLITDGFFGHARVIRTEIQQLVASLDRAAIPLVAGFQGVSPDGHAITTLGEGGSDYTAVCLAYALTHAERTPLQEPLDVGAVEIFKEVDGVMTANPVHFADTAEPRTIRRLTYDELCALSHYGADVIQAEAARMARRYDLKVAVRNFRRPHDAGTIITRAEREAARAVTGVADMPSMTVFRVPEGGERVHHRISELLAQVRVNYQAVTVRDGGWKFAVKREKYRNVTETVARLLHARGVVPAFEDGQWGLVTLVGEGLRERVTETAARVRDVLDAAGIPADGEIHDELSYSVLVPEDKRQAAVLALHRAFCSTNVESVEF